MSYQTTNYKRRKKTQQPDVLQSIVIGIFKVLWWLVKLPFPKKGKLKISQSDINSVRIKRDKIESLLDSQNEIELRHALLEADKLVDHILKINNFEGETFADRLRSAENSMDSDLYESIWQGHKIRNHIAHEHESRITNQELRIAANKLLRYIKNV